MRGFFFCGKETTGDEHEDEEDWSASVSGCGFSGFWRAGDGAMRVSSDWGWVQGFLDFLGEGVLLWLRAFSE